jgi:hypothetical protein
LLWDVPAGVVYSACSQANQDKLLELFGRTTGLELQPMSVGAISLRLLEKTSGRRDYEDAKPTRFAYGPEGESQYPEYPWVAKGPEPKDFLGNEFLLWLWHAAEAGNGTINLAGGDVSILIDKSIQLDCAYGLTGKDTLSGTAPARMPEALDALRSGKLPRKFGLLLDYQGSAYGFGLNAESFGVNGLKLPEIEEADTPRVLFEERVTQLRDFCQMVDGLLAKFLEVRLSSAWEGKAGQIRKWINKTSKPTVSVDLVPVA